MTEALNLNFEDIYKEYHDQLFRAAYRLTGNREDTEEVIQETYLNAFRAFAKFEGKSAVSTWIYRIMINCSYRYMKKRDKLPIQIIAAEKGITEAAFWESIESHESVEETAMIEDIRETCIQLFLICMPRKQRIAFTLKTLMQLPSSEVASIMEISENAVKVNVYRAKQHLKNNIDGRCSLINPKNPCRCANWQGYLIETGKIHNIPPYNPAKTRSLAEMDRISTEMTFLRQITSLYDNHPRQASSEEFIKKMRDLIAKGTLKVLA